jgi:uncharacterized MAPEG superfamily protein
MSVPIWALLGFATWTVLLMAVTVGTYRWYSIIAGHHGIGYFRSDVSQGPGWYQRAMRAHANCAENLPVFGAIVLALQASGTRGSVVDLLAATVLPTRMLQSLVHVARVQDNFWVSLRFSLFFVQLVVFGVLVALVVRHACN